jgi:hypothetical protein
VAFQQRSAEEHTRLLQQYREAEAAFLANDNKARMAPEPEYQTALARYEELKKEIAVAEEIARRHFFRLVQTTLYLPNARGI